MSRRQGIDPGSINSEDAAVVSAYVKDNLATRQASMDSGRSAESRVSSVGKLDGSAVVHASDAHAALKRALSLVRKQENGGMPMDQEHVEQNGSIGDWHAVPREQEGSLKFPAELKPMLASHLHGQNGDSEALQRGTPQLQVKGRPGVHPNNGLANGYSAGTSDAALQAFVRSAFTSLRSSAEGKSG